MFILDRLLVGGLTFVLDKIAVTADRELNSEPALHERLLAAEMQLELGEIDETEFRAIERDVVRRLRDIREQAQGERGEEGTLRVESVEANLEKE